MQWKSIKHRGAGALLAALLAAGLVAVFTGMVFGADRVPQVAQDDAAATATMAALLTKQSELLATLTAQAATLTPTAPPPPAATPTPQPTATPRPVQPVAEALVAKLNIRAGPGGGFEVIGNAVLGQQFPITGQSGGCAWLQAILEDGSTGWISGAAAYTRLNVPCAQLPATGGTAPAPAPTRAAQPVAAPTATLAAAPAPAAAAPASAPAVPGQVTGFEPFGTWRIGDEPHGSFVQSTAQKQSGAASAELRYTFPASAGSRNYVVFMPQPALRIPDGAQSLQVQVYGDGAGHFLNAWVGDAAGTTWQFTFGRVNHTGWAPMTVSLTPSREWPNGPIAGGAGDQLVAPLSLKGLVLDGVPDGVDSNGVIYLDTLVASASATVSAASAGAAPAGAAEAGTTADAAPAAAPAPAGPLTGKIAYTRVSGSGMDTLIYDLATNRYWAEISDVRQPDLAGGLLLVNGGGGGKESILRMNDSGGNVRPITAHPEDAFPQWSPSMASLVYVSTSFGDRRSRLFWQEDAGAQFEVGPMLYNKRELFGDYPVYLDNWRIAFQGCNTWAGGSKCGIYTTDTKGGEPVQATSLTADIPTGNLGAQVLFTSNRSGNYDVWIVGFEGSGLRQLTDNPAIDGLAVASPDSRQIAFVSNRGGVWSVYAMNTDGTNQRKLFDLNGSYGSGDFEWYRERISWGP